MTRNEAWTQMRHLLPQGMALPQSTWDARHGFVLWVLAGHAAALPILGFERGFSAVYSLGEPLLIALLALAASLPGPSARLRATAAAVGLVASSAILIQFSGGRIEAHLHSFVVVALVALYQEWTPMLAGLLGALGLLAINVAYAPPADEPWKWALVQAVALLAEVGALLAFWAGAEQARARSAVVLDAASDGVVGLNGAGQVVFANPAAEKLLGRSADNAFGRDARALVPGLGEHLGHRRLRPMAATLHALDGREIPVEWTLNPTHDPSAGIASVLVLRDTTRRLALERQLEAQTQQHEFLAHLGRIALETGDLSGATAYVALHLPCLVGADAALLEPAPGGPAAVGAHPAPPATWRTLSAPVEARGQPWGVLVVHAAPDHPFTREAPRFVQQVATLLSAIVGRQAAEADLRDHKDHLEATVASRTAQLTEANHELEAFSYTVSHDLRSPLRAIDGFSRILVQRHGRDLPEDSRRMLAMLSDGALRMGNLIESVLSLSRINRAVLASAPVDLSTLANNVVRELRGKDPGRTVSVRIQEGLVAQGDPGLLRMVVDNLLANAWKFTARTPSAHIEFTGRRQDGVWVYTVQDNGAGFDMAHAKELFQPFHRLHQPSQFEGTGIGLATVSRIVKRHGGEIWAEGHVDAGARFSFSLQPLPGAKPAPGAARPHAGGTPAAPAPSLAVAPAALPAPAAAKATTLLTVDPAPKARRRRRVS
jgi:PAS domain S-box-containing protein